MRKDISKEEIRKYILKHGRRYRNADIARTLKIAESLVRYHRSQLGVRFVEKKKKRGLPEDIELHRAKGARKETSKKYRDALKRIDELEAKMEEVFKIKKTPQTITIRPKRGGSSEAVAVALASDWHVEESVIPSTVSDLNKYNLDISQARAEKFFVSLARLIQIFQKDTRIDTLILALLGDFFSNNIHEELAESNLLLPGDAAWCAQNYLVAGIQYLLAHTNVKLIIPCHTGNHGRMTKKVHISTEEGNSLEHYMYRNMAQFFEGEPRVQFIIAEGQHTYIQVYDLTLRFLHGHSIKFGGGVGGITIPVRKAVAQWNKARRANVTFFGHFHQCIDGGDFVGNGSLIGYNAFALSIKADYEPPAQQFVLISNYKGGRKEGVLPIRVE